MSTRVLRKLRQQLEQEPKGSEEDESEEELRTIKPNAINAFDMLNQVEDNDTGSESGAEASEMPRPPDQPIASATEGKPKSKRKKKGKKKRERKDKTDMANTAKHAVNAGSELDEIDLALKSLSTDKDADTGIADSQEASGAALEVCQLLAIDAKFLNATTEMKRLFGNVALESDDNELDHGTRRRRGPRQLDLGGALAGRNSPASRGRGLAGLALRRNVLGVPGKETWPLATTGGLGMEPVEKLSDGTTEFRFVHNTAYQDVQRQFETCVESMDPQRMIQLLQFNPYHISTLLQVSEIAKQQGDHSVSGDLLERALFSFGRATHTSFVHALSEGKARLDFRRPENREFWLTAWRYIGNLGQRGTWRTCYEWAKLVLSLDPEGDPYCICMIIDQLAIRGGQAEHFVKLCESSLLEWIPTRPNFAISLGLAKSKIKDPQGARLSLRKSIESYPYIFSRLFQELNLERIPPSIWAKQPRTQREKLECETYVNYAKDIWNTPDAVSLLVEVVESTVTSSSYFKLDNQITLEEARHIVLSTMPTLINLLPREYTSTISSSSDPLPPPDNLPSYLSGLAADSEDAFQGASDEEPPGPGSRSENAATQSAQDEADEQELRGLRNFFTGITGIAPWFLRTEGGEGRDDDQNGLDRSADGSGVSQVTLTERRNRFIQLWQRIMNRNQATPERIPEILHNLTDESRPEDRLSGPDDEEFLPDLVAAEEAVPATDTPLPARQDDYDDERNQRWLAGQGMIGLRDFVAKHGFVEDAWGAHSQAGHELFFEYANRVKQLRQQRTRDFIVNYPLRQGTSIEVRDLVITHLQRGR
ncbi:MAG: hypothetical protein LQ342_003848 [Letrouitia transgressa]|nr:MAG: hypothetical protein LQ342_003848 [Letrouitia transgressa]